MMRVSGQSATLALFRWSRSLDRRAHDSVHYMRHRRRFGLSAPVTSRGTHAMLLRFGAIVIALVAIISGIAGILIGGIVAVTGTALDVMSQPGQANLEMVGGYALIVAGLMVMVAGLLQVIFGIGMWKLSAWAWIAGVIIQLFTLTTAFLGLFTGVAIPASLITIAVSGAILAFLLTPHVRKAFGRGERSTDNVAQSGRALR